MDYKLLSDNFIENILGNQAVLSTFPELAKIKSKPPQKKAGCCGSKTPQYIDKARQYIIAMPPPQVEKLKVLIGLKKEQKLRTWVNDGRAKFKEKLL